MIDRLRAAVARVWPVVRLRWMLLAVLVFAAALPGIAALSLRVYENALVRRTEAEIAAQGTVLAASAALFWPGAGTAAAAGPADTRQDTAYSRGDDQADISTRIDQIGRASCRERV